MSAEPLGGTCDTAASEAAPVAPPAAEHIAEEVPAGPPSAAPAEGASTPACPAGESVAGDLLRGSNGVDAAGSEPEPSAAVSMSVEVMLTRVADLKVALDDKTATGSVVLEALGSLRALGSLPTKVLGDTLIGKSVNHLAKAAPDEAVRTRARELVEEWRQSHRKRKSAAMGGDSTPTALKRTLSDGASLFSEPALSQDSLAAPGLDSSQSQTQQRTPETQRSLSRMDSFMSMEGDGVVKEKMAPYRDKVRAKILEALGKAEEIETRGGGEGDEEMRDPVVLASEIEEELFTSLGGKKEAYMNQARSVLYNLKDNKNVNFRFKLMVGYYKPKDVPMLNAEDMASDEKNAQRAKQRQEGMEEIDQGWAMKHGQQRITGMFTCGKCKGVKTTYFQMQTRSSDEPMTTFVTCLTCNNRWKFC